LLLVAFLFVNVPNCHLSLVLASAVQGDAVNCNSSDRRFENHWSSSLFTCAQVYVELQLCCVIAGCS